ncbi:MAG: hypothetical protein IKD31_01035 [Clostridia bacterium]|nr:hypothetical protein [Clostridia bacterium]
MKRIKSAGILLFLAAATVAALAIPEGLWRGWEKKRIREGISIQFESRSRPNLTDFQLADLFCRRESFFTYPSANDLRPSGLSESEKEELFSVTDALFQEKALSEWARNLWYEGAFCRYGRSSMLVNVENYPTSLQFVNVIFQGERGSMDILYEKRTKAVLRFSLEISDLSFESAEELKAGAQRTAELWENYYASKLQVSREYFFSYADFPLLVEKEKGYEAILVTGGGLL